MILTETGEYFIINYHLRQSEGVMPYYVNSARGARCTRHGESVNRVDLATFGDRAPTLWLTAGEIGVFCSDIEGSSWQVFV